MQYYSTPRSTKKSKLINFISETYHYLKSSKYPSAYFALGGDINDLKVDLLLNISPKFHQIVKNFTRESKILSVIKTDLSEYYQTPIILPPLQPDVMGVGKPSDHSVPFAIKYLDRGKPRPKNFTLKEVRPFPDSGVSEFGRWIQFENFSFLNTVDDPTEKVSAFENIISVKVDAIFPTKEVKIHNLDKEFMSNQMRILRRQKSREYSRKGRSEKFLKMQKEFLDLKSANSIKYIEEIEELKNCNLGQFFKKIKQIGARQGEIVNKTFQLPSHSEQNLSTEESAEIIAKHFSSISKEYPPIDAEKLPSRVKDRTFCCDEQLKN